MLKNEKIIFVLVLIIIVIGVMFGIICFRTARDIGRLNSEIEEGQRINNSLRNTINEITARLQRAEEIVRRIGNEQHNTAVLIGGLGETNTNIGIGISEAEKIIEEAHSILDSILDTSGR